MEPLPYERLPENSKRALKTIFDTGIARGWQIQKELNLQNEQQVAETITPLIENHYIQSKMTYAPDGILSGFFNVMPSNAFYISRVLTRQAPLPPRHGH